MDSGELFMQYVMKFGMEAVPPLFQMPPEQQTEKFIDELYERCLREGKPASEYITIENDPDVIY